MILDRYLIREVARPLLVVLAVLAVIFAGYSAAAFLARAASGLLKVDTVVALIVLKTLIAAEVLLPIALYVTTVLGMGRLAVGNELTAMNACGFGPHRVQAALSRLFFCVAIVVGVLSLWVRPLAYTWSYDLRARAEVAFDLADVKPGRFYESGDGARVLFVDQLDPSVSAMRGVFAWLDRGDDVVVVHADEVIRSGAALEGRPTVEVRGLRVWEIGEEASGLTMSASRLITELDLDRVAPVGYKRKAAPTPALFGATHPQDVAELQWRLSRPLSTLLLGFLALRLCRGRPRRDRWARIVVALLAYVGYYLLNIAAKNWVEDGVVGPIPGLWWVDAVLGVVLLITAPRSGGAP